jgi:hypothetical protein
LTVGIEHQLELVLFVIALMSSPTSVPNPHVPERRFRYQLPHDALAELQKSLDAGEQDRLYFHKNARTMEAPPRWMPPRLHR